MLALVWRQQNEDRRPRALWAIAQFLGAIGSGRLQRSRSQK